MVDDDRDERIGAWLETEPLDDVTRRRLVSNALRERDIVGPAPRRPSYARRWIATAAAIVVVLVGALALLTANGGQDEPRASTPVGAPDRAPDRAPEAAAAGVAPVDLGDFGDLSRAANLTRLRTALEQRPTDAARATSPTPSRSSPFSTPACRDRLPRGTVTAVGTGELDGRPAVVVLTVLPDGSRSIDAVLSHPCEVRRLS